MLKDREKAIIYLAIAACLWSTGGLFIKLVDMNPIAIAGIRSGIAAVVMLIYLRKPVFHFDRINITGAFVYASLLLCFVGANKLTTSANAIFLQYTSPVWVILMAAIILKEKIRRSDCITVIAVLLGMALFFVGGFGGGTPLGNGIALVSGVFQAGLVIVTKMQKRGSAVEIALLGNILTLLISIPFIPHKIPDTTSILALLFLGIFQLGIPYIFYMLAIKKVTSVEALLIPVLEPLLNPVWVFLFTGEKVAITALFGGIIVISSILINELVTTWKKKSIQATEATDV